MQRRPSSSYDKRIWRAAVALLVLCALTAALSAAPNAAPDAAPDATPVKAADNPAPASWTLQARVVAVGLPGVSGVRQVGRFHRGGPIPGNPEFLLRTESGRVLDPERVLVAVASNFGAQPAAPGQAVGSVLSIDTRRTAPLRVPRDFAAGGTQSAALGGAVQLYSAQSAAFLNSRHNAGARTAAQAAVAGPRYLSINNAFGRPWIANAPGGLRGAGSVSVLDPDGAPLANPPSDTAGGVFAGHDTARKTAPQRVQSGLWASWFNQRPSAQLTPGALATGALGTAFLGPSPDGSGLAVFAVATADGALTQVHVQDGVDGLAPPGTLALGHGDPGVVGMAFKWNPQRALYVTDAARHRVLVVHLGDDQRHYTVTRVEPLESPAFRQPVDLAPATPEVANPRFASHTTLAGGSDLYVANRGDGTLLRIDAQGRVLARARIEVPALGALGADRICAIAVSADTQRLWLTIDGALPGFDGHPGALIEVSAFDADGAVAAPPTVASTALPAPVHVGEALFRKAFTPAEGLGPLFNARSCMSCHSTPGIGGMSSADEHFARRVARMDTASGRVLPVNHPNSPLARRQSTRGTGAWLDSDTSAAALPRQANVVSLRMPPALYPVARLDEIADATIEAQAVPKGDGILGRVNRVNGPGGEARVGRYGWKADTATLELMVADAFANELGVHSALARPLQQPVEDDGSQVRAVVAFLRSLVLPARPAAQVAKSVP